MSILSCIKNLIRCLMNNSTLSANHFTVQWGGSRINFSEVSGLSIEYDLINYRGGASGETTVSTMPGLRKENIIILKRCISRGDNEFFEWISSNHFNSAQKRDLLISLLNELHEPVMTWKVKNAWPVKLEGPVLKADASEVAIETLQLVHEGISVENI
ncbi:T4-like virus tail tube protein gp19 [anaerobic digester metagenome]